MKGETSEKRLSPAGESDIINKLEARNHTGGLSRQSGCVKKKGAMDLPSVNYQWNPAVLGEVFAVPAAVVDDHIKMAGSAQLKVLLWLLREGRGSFDPERCSAAIGVSPADCSDALQYWFATGLMLPVGETFGAPPAVPSPEKAAPSTPAPSSAAATRNPPAARPRPVKPSMKEVIARQKESAEFSYLLETASARLGRPISQGDMETLLYLYDTAGLPAEVILMVVEYAVAEGKYHMRFIEKVALDWADRGITTMAAAEQHLCALERRRQAWNTVSALLGLTQSPTIAQSDAAERWVCDWQVNEGLLRLAYERCREATGKFNSSYMDKILEHWRMDGVDTVEKALAEKPGKRKSKKAAKETSFDLDEYESMVSEFTPVYKK